MMKWEAYDVIIKNLAEDLKALEYRYIPPLFPETGHILVKQEEEKKEKDPFKELTYS